MTRVTADSNIYISAFQFRGNPLRLLVMAAEQKIDLAVSEHIIEEVTRTLRAKFDWPDGRIEQTLRIMRRIARIVSPVHSVTLLKDDPTDNRILECALAAESEFLVTGDEHLLRHGTYAGVKIVTLTQFLLGS